LDLIARSYDMKPNRTRKAAFVILCLLIVSHTLRAGINPGSWDRVDSLAGGTKLIKKLKAGNRMEGVFRKADSDEIVVSDWQGVEHRISKSDVARVEAMKRSGRRGALIGAVAGAVPMAALGALFGRAIGESGGDAAKGAALFGGVGAGIGALVGYAVGKIHKDIQTLYVAPGGEPDRPRQ
jgi:hypothetical protein